MGVDRKTTTKLGRAFRKKDGSFQRAKEPKLVAKETKIKSNIWSLSYSERGHCSERS